MSPVSPRISPAARSSERPSTDPPPRSRDPRPRMRRAGRGRPRARAELDAPADDHLDEVVLGDRRVASVPATRPSRSTVARSVISITSSTSWETKMTLAPSRDDPADQRRRARRRRPRGRKGVGSSSTSRPRRRAVLTCAELVEGADDRERAPAPPGESRADRPSGSMSSPKRAKRSRAPARARARQSIRQRSSVGEVGRCRRFSRTVSDGMRPRCWWTKLMPSARNRAGRERQRHRLAMHDQLAPGSGSWKPGEDLDQRRLARAVLAEQAVHLAAARRAGRRRPAPGRRRSASRGSRCRGERRGAPSGRPASAALLSSCHSFAIPVDIGVAIARVESCGGVPAVLRVRLVEDVEAGSSGP